MKWIRTSSAKTGTPVYVPLLKQAILILSIYNQATEYFFFSVTDFRGITSLDRNVAITKYLIANVEPAFCYKNMHLPRCLPWVTSHTCRQSSRTSEFLAGTPVELIMKIGGHKILCDSYNYIRITSEEASRKNS